MYYGFFSFSVGFWSDLLIIVGGFFWDCAEMPEGVRGILL